MEVTNFYHPDWILLSVNMSENGRHVIISQDTVEKETGKMPCECFASYIIYCV